MPLHIVLYQPEIPPNTGNIIRLCANTGAQLHLIHPLGFSMTDKSLKRAGLDYSEWALVKEHTSWEAFLSQENPARIFACTTKAEHFFSAATYEENDYLLFGCETSGLPEGIRNSIDRNYWLRIPMQKNSRSLNLSNAVAVILYEALRQLDYPELL